MSKILVTGCAGFIGFHFSSLSLGRGDNVCGIDNLNNYYDVNLKLSRLERLAKNKNFTFIKQNIADSQKIRDIVLNFKPDYIVHLAAQAGVRYSLKNPFSYIESNIQGFTSLIDSAKEARVKHFIYASSSSVYGANSAQPFKETDSLNHPLSLYAATKKSNELIAHSYSNIFGVPTTGLRFFTVYGPWGRPDMALFLFTKNILEKKPIKVFNYGELARDFTYVDDVVEAIYKLSDKTPVPDAHWDSKKPNPSSSFCPYRIYNVGNNRPIQLDKFINAIESTLGEKAIIEYLPMQPGDVPSTYAEVSSLHDAIGYMPKVEINEGVEKFISWYIEYNKIKKGVANA